MGTRPRPRQAKTPAAGALIHAAEPCPEQELLKIVEVEEGPEEGASNVGPRGRRVRHFRGVDSAEPGEGRWRGRRVRLHVLRRVLH
jgi:hypothetical protein